MEKGRILIVDDEKLFLLAAERELSEEGYYVRTAKDGRTALEIFKNDKFDIVLTDLIMPGMNGVELCREIKKLSPKMEVVLLSGTPEELSKFEVPFIQAGGREEYLRKPLSENELIKTIEKVMKERGEKEA